MINTVIHLAHNALRTQLDTGVWGESTAILNLMVDNLPNAKVLGSVNASRLPKKAAEIESVLGHPVEGIDGWSVVAIDGVGDDAMILIAATRYEAGQEVNLIAIPITIVCGRVSVTNLAHAVWDGTDALPDLAARDLTGVIDTLPDDLQEAFGDLARESAVTAVLATAVAAGRAA